MLLICSDELLTSLLKDISVSASVAGMIVGVQDKITILAAVEVVFRQISAFFKLTSFLIDD